MDELNDRVRPHRERSRTFQGLRERYEKIPPEVEYVLGAVVTYLMLEFMLFPDHAPPLFARYLELLDTIQGRLPPLSRSVEMLTHGAPLSTLVLGIGTLIGFVGSVDGARRIVMDQLPLYRAYVQVFLLGAANADEPDADDAPDPS